MDWDRMMTNAARGRDFTGRSAGDEQAYFEAFAGEEDAKGVRPSLRGIGTLCVSLIGFIGAGFMLR